MKNLTSNIDFPNMNFYNLKHSSLNNIITIGHKFSVSKKVNSAKNSLNLNSQSNIVKYRGKINISSYNFNNETGITNSKSQKSIKILNNSYLKNLKYLDKYNKKTNNAFKHLNKNNLINNNKKLFNFKETKSIIKNKNQTNNDKTQQKISLINFNLNEIKKDYLNEINVSSNNISNYENQSIRKKLEFKTNNKNYIDNTNANTNKKLVKKINTFKKIDASFSKNINEFNTQKKIFIEKLISCIKNRYIKEKK